MEPLNLSVPGQHRYIDPTVETDPAQLVKWVLDLPLMNVVETVRLVCSALGALNEQKLEPELRFRCLEVYFPAVQRLLETLDPLHIRQISMSREQRQATVAATAQLLGNIASGYKLIAMDLQGRGARGLDAPLFAKVINRSVETLGYMLLDCYRFYRTVSPVLISELHQLYRAARYMGLLGTSIPDKQGQASAKTATLYKYSMLLSLTEPDRLAEGKISLLADVLREHADKCRIVQGNRWAGNGEGLFLLDLASEDLPCSCAASPPTESDDPYLLDTTDMLGAMRECLAHSPERVRHHSPEAIVLQHLLPEERGASLRREQRHRDGRWISLLHGLEHIHAYLLQAAGKHSPAALTGDTDPVDCRVLDCSKGGMKLFWAQGGAGDARVGDLLGIIEGEPGQQTLLLACIRSLRVLEEGGLETGVETVTNGLGPVNCSLPEQPDVSAVRALFLPAEEQADIAATLVAAKGLYEDGRAITIDVGGREIHVRAGQLISDSPVFDRFEFSAE